MFFEQAEANLEHLRPLDVAIPVNLKCTAQERQEIYAAQKPSPEEYPNSKEDSIPQPGNDLTHTHMFKVH
jgi:hypothetical protein